MHQGRSNIELAVCMKYSSAMKRLYTHAKHALHHCRGLLSIEHMLTCTTASLFITAAALHTHTALRYIATGIRAGGASRQSAALALRSCCAACEKWIVLDIGAIEALLPLLSVAQHCSRSPARARIAWPCRMALFVVLNVAQCCHALTRREAQAPVEDQLVIVEAAHYCGTAAVVANTFTLYCYTLGDTCIDSLRACSCFGSYHDLRYTSAADTGYRAQRAPCCGRHTSAGAMQLAPYARYKRFTYTIIIVIIYSCCAPLYLRYRYDCVSTNQNAAKVAQVRNRLLNILSLVLRCDGSDCTCQVN
eukprot:13232-Heterococcus_DN1.PRE.4